MQIRRYRSIQAPVIDLIWQQFDRYITLSGVGGVLMKTLSDQIFLAPPSLLAFFYSQAWLEGKSAPECRDRATRMFLPTYQACLPFWCCAHSVTFGLILRNSIGTVALPDRKSVLTKQHG